MTTYEDGKGNWAASFFQRGSTNTQLNEQHTKAACPTGSFDPYKIPQLLNPTISKEEEYIQKKKSGKKLTTTENMIVANYLDKKQKMIENDLNKIGMIGANYKPETNEGKLTVLFMAANYHIDKNNFDMVYYTFCKISEYTIPQMIMDKYSELWEKVKRIVSELNTIELQFTKFYSNMPPLNKQGFEKLDDFQIEVINNIDNKISTIVQAPTSAGKSILTGHLYTKENKVVVVVPTDPLALQMASMIGKITGKDIPLITRTFQSKIDRNELVEIIEKIGIVVGTPRHLADYLPLIQTKFDWLVVDEIHMIGQANCSEMELIIKTFSDIPILALSATIGNIDMLVDWFHKIGNINMKKVICNKRFFNLQKYYYDNEMEDGPFVRLHPLSMVTYDDFVNKNVLNLALNPTPPDVWTLANDIEKILPADLKIMNYFKNDQRITLDDSNKYFNAILTYLVDNAVKKEKTIKKIINHYSTDDIEITDYDIYDIANDLKKKKMTPAIIFRTNSHDCLCIARKFSKRITHEEEKAHPTLMKERLKMLSRAKAAEKQVDQLMKDKNIKMDSMTEKQRSKMIMSGTLDKINTVVIDVSLNEPHNDFIMNNHQVFTNYMVEQWDKELKFYFPHNGCEYHYLIDLLWRGVGVYSKGLPDAYLHLVQILACEGKLAIVFSDESLIFGVSMPFRTTIITPDHEEITDKHIMEYHQMAGRAGRRGLDKEGNVIILGRNGNDIKKLTSSMIPNVSGCDTMFYGNVYASRVNDIKRWDNIKTNFLFDPINEDCDEFYQQIETNLANGWKFAANDMKRIINDKEVMDNKSFFHMLWRLRHSEDCFRVPFIINFMRKIFRNINVKNESTQVELALFLSHYIEIHEATDDTILPEAMSASKFNIMESINMMGLNGPEQIDGRIYESIRANRLVDTVNHGEKSILRERLLNFGEKIQAIQHYFYYCNETELTRLCAKLMTRIWWVYHNSSPVMESIDKYD